MNVCDIQHHGVRMVDTTTVMTLRAESFVEPVQKGHEIMSVTDVAFLLDHQASGMRVMFDLGCRKDYWNLPAVIQKRLGVVIPALRVDQDIVEILAAGEVALNSICTCANRRSHSHDLLTSSVRGID